MTRRTRSTSLLLAGTLAGTLASTVVLASGWATAAHADRASDAPITAPDRVTVAGTTGRAVAVLRNDSDPQDDTVHLCRVDVPEDTPLSVEINRDPFVDFGDDLDADDELSDTLLVQSTANHSGSYTVTYYACDDEFLTPGTLTVTVDRVQPLRATAIKTKRGVVRLTNPDEKKFSVIYGTSFDKQPLGRVGVRGHDARRVRLPGARLVFAAFQPQTGFFQTGRLRLDREGRVVVSRDRVAVPSARAWATR